MQKPVLGSLLHQLYLANGFNWEIPIEEWKPKMFAITNESCMYTHRYNDLSCVYVYIYTYIYIAYAYIYIYIHI
jgi:hypothetical protein